MQSTNRVDKINFIYSINFMYSISYFDLNCNCIQAFKSHKDRMQELYNNNLAKSRKGIVVKGLQFS